MKYHLDFLLNFVFLILSVESQANEMNSVRHPPCYFNPLCTCSKVVPDLGIVSCQDTLLSRIPSTINGSKVFMLQLNNVGLRSIEPYFLQNTGLYKLFIMGNPLYLISDEAFFGLERTLWKLDLSNNELLSVPSKALKYLQKLRFLDLSGNRVTRVYPDSWNGLENSLETLLLEGNSITHLSPDTFTGLPHLDTINLKGNNLREIDPSVFRDGMDKLSHIILANNQLRSIPYLALSPLKMLKTLDLSYNRINKMNPTVEAGVINIHLDVRMSLDLLNLAYNQITILESGAFQYFNILNRTYLDGNQLIAINENAFRQAKIREIYLRDCGLTEVSPAAFDGLENYLQILDLSGNNITGLQDDLLLKFNMLQSLSLANNLLRNFNLLEAINGFQHTLYSLDISGIRNDPVPLHSLRSLRNLRTLFLSQLSQQSLTSDIFSEFGTDLEEVHITFGQLQSIKNGVFRFVHGLKLLDLSENKITQIESEAFSDIGNSLISLQLSHAFSSSMDTLPSASFKPLSNLLNLVINNNRIKNVPDTSFHFLRKLRTLEFQDNEIGQLQKGTFQGDLHSDLQSIYLSFNNIKTIQQHTFADLPMLEQLHLDDNLIAILERRSFINLENLKRLNLKGNKLVTIPYECFQNIPELEDLDISYNQLTDFQFSIFDQVGTLAAFRVNVSHNKLIDLNPTANYNIDSETGPEDFHSNIKLLDLSYNNISQISRQYLRPVELSLTHLYISHNGILNASQEVFGNMPHLQWLDLSFNRLMEVDYDTFRNSRSLQILLLSNNFIAEIPKDLFRSLYNLRVVDFSHNRLRFLPDNLFKNEGLEHLDLSSNQLSRLPLLSMSPAASSSLCELDLSWNGISSITNGEMFSKFESLSWLDLSHNRLVQLDIGAFGYLPKIVALNLSHNSQLVLDKYGKTFQGCEDSLLFLYLDDISLTHVPQLPLQNLISLSLAHNSLPTIPPEMSANLSSLRILNLADNDLTAVPIVTHSLNNLKVLSLSGNAITILSNTSLLGVANHLEELDVTALPLHAFETGALNKMIYLQTLKISAYNMVRNFNIPRILECNFALEKLEVQVEKDTDLKSEMFGRLPPKLKEIVIGGTLLKELHSEILNGLQSPNLHFSLKNTGISRISSTVFDDLYLLRNLSLDISNNENLQQFQNPSSATKPGIANEIFLTDVSLHGNKWNCDCDLGWVEIWQRKRRQYLCNNGFNTLPSYNSLAYLCRHVHDDIRNSVCVNKANRSLIEVLKTEIECEWNSASSRNSFTIILLPFVATLLQKSYSFYF